MAACSLSTDRGVRRTMDQVHRLIMRGTPNMSTIAPPRPTPSPADPDVYRLTVDEYERLAEAGVLDDPQVELIEGLLFRKMTQKPPHAWAVETAHTHLNHMLPTGWFIREEKPVRIPRFNEPEPDLSVIRGNRDDFRGRHPGPKDIALLVEVADTSLDRDRGPKKTAYGRDRIPVYWIINLVDRQVEVYSNPRRGVYHSSQIFKPGQDVPIVIDGSMIGSIAVADILP
jgi:Uma2 family endonuclease